LAQGRDHDRATALLSLPIGLGTALLLNWPSGLIAAAAFSFGGLWLSPDLDTRCRALRRWGPLQFIWWPYQRLIPHRSLLSHGPVIGTSLRLMLLFLWASVLCAQITMEMFWRTLNLWSTANPDQLIAVAVGLEGSVWLHLIQDGDPLPIEWHAIQRIRQRFRRRR
jgi:uncharacterized metal-binding protein